MTDTASARPDGDTVGLKIGSLALILCPVCVVSYFFAVSLVDWRETNGGSAQFPSVWLKLLIITGASVVLPLIAYSYFFFRRQRRGIEIDRICQALPTIPREYTEMFKRARSGSYFLLSVALTWLITSVGLLVLVFGEAIWVASGDAGATQADAYDFPKDGSSLVFGMAFLGSYMWGLQYIFRRYNLNDLLPGAFIRLSIRMLIASTVALIIFNAFEELIGSGEVGFGAWPAVAFFLGAFPQRGLNWITSRIPFLSDQANPSVRDLPLEMIEGIDSYDHMRLEEIGIDNCYDLANYDFVPLILKTSYGPREVTDWILQAKLCVYCGDAVTSLRQHGIRGIHDLAAFQNTKELEPLAAETAATLSSLKRAWTVARKDEDIRRLQEIAGRLTRFTRDPVPEPAPAEPVATNDVLRSAAAPARAGAKAGPESAAGRERQETVP